MKQDNGKKSKKSKEAKRYRRLPLVIVVCALALLILGAVTVISRERARRNQTQAAEAKPVAASETPGNFITVKVAGQNVQVNAQTGQIKPLSPQEAQQLAEGLRGMLNRSSEGLVPVREADGSLSMDLQGRFQNVTVARINEDGTVSESCVDNPEAAANFFGIDPQLLGVEHASQPARPVQRNKSPIQ